MFRWIPIGLLALALLGDGGTTLARAEEANCMQTDALIEKIQENKRDHVVLRGDQLKSFLSVIMVAGAPLEVGFDPEYAIVVFLDNAAIVVWGNGTLVCDPMPMPLNLAKSILRSADNTQ